jgi:hypothetical protein
MSTDLASDWVVHRPDWLGFGYVFWTCQCLQGPECGSSPTSGTADPLVRGDLCFNMCASLWWRPSEPGAGFGLAAAVAYSGVLGGGFRALAAWALRLLCCSWMVSSSLFCLVGRGWPTPIHGLGLPVQHDVTDFGTRFFLKISFYTSRGPHALDLSWRSGCGHCPHLRLLYCSVRGDVGDDESNAIRTRLGIWRTWFQGSSVSARAPSFSL